MPKTVDLDALAAEYEQALRDAEEAADVHRKHLDAVNLLRALQSPEMVSTNGVEPPTSVKTAVDVLLPRGPTRAGELSEMIRRDFPGVAAGVQNLDRSVRAALSYGLKMRTYKRGLERGIYAIAE